MLNTIFILVALLSDGQRPTLVQYESLEECNGGIQLAITLPFKEVVEFKCIEITEGAA